MMLFDREMTDKITDWNGNFLLEMSIFVFLIEFEFIWI